MPYPRSPLYMLAVIAVIIGGFWPTYFSVWLSAPWQFHLHAIAASLWVLMVTCQSWSARQAKSLHRSIGLASLVLFPFLTAGLTAIIDVTAKGFVAGNDPLRVEYGGSLMVIVLVALVAYLTLYHQALKHRRRVWQHAGYMLATPLILFESAFHRLLLWYVPGAADPQMFLPGISFAMSVELAAIAIIWLRIGARAKPLLVAAGFIIAQMLGMIMLRHAPPITALLRLVGTMPSAQVVAIGFVLGAVASWTGWVAGGNRLSQSRANQLPEQSAPEPH